MSAIDLPPEEERVALLDALGDLIVARGHHPLVRWPLRRPSPEDFPDRWTPDMEGASRMAKRLMAHAGLADLGCIMEPFGEEERARSAVGLRLVNPDEHRAAAWFRGIHEGQCWFGVNVTELRDPESLAAALAHEVAHAYRHHHALAVEDQALEEQLTDLTTVFLGFGILTTNEADRFRSNFHGWSRSAGGYLSPPSMALLLAAQLVARGASPRDRRKVREVLERNQAAALGQALQWLEPRESEIRGRLHVPLEVGPPAAIFSTVPSAPFPQDSLQAGVVPPPEHAGHPVFFVRQTPWTERIWRTGYFALLGVFVTIFAKDGWPIALSLGAAFAYDLWRVQKCRQCSGCEGWLRLEEKSCAKCGGFVAGEIERRRDHHDAVVEYQKAHGIPVDDPLEEDEGVDQAQ